MTTYRLLLLGEGYRLYRKDVELNAGTVALIREGLEQNRDKPYGIDLGEGMEKVLMILDEVRVHA